jgi:MoxR-like ATPase
MDMRRGFEEILAHYALARTNKEPRKDHELWSVLKQLKGSIEATDAVANRSNLKTKPSVGQDKYLGTLPWIALSDTRETSTTQRGVYCVYLFREDMSGVYLAFAQGVAEFKERYGGWVKSREHLQARVDELRQYCRDLPEHGFSLDTPNLHTENPYGKAYEASTIAHKFYATGSVPPNSALAEDLDAILTAYDRYLERETLGVDRGEDLSSHSTVLDEIISWVSHLRTQANQDGRFHYKPLVLLAALNVLDRDSSHPNSLGYDDLLTEFKRLAAERGSDITEDQFSQPYVRLRNDTTPLRVWVPQTAGVVSLDDAKSKQPSYVRTHAPSVAIDDAAWPAFASPEGREAIRHELNARWSPLGRRIVKVAPGHKAGYWEDCLEGGYICVGWDETGDLRSYPSKEAFRVAFGEHVGYSSEAKATQKANELWTLRELKPGDLIVANEGTSRILAVGEVLDPGYVWRPDRPEYKHTLSVAWDTSYAMAIPKQKDWAFFTVRDVKPQLYDYISGKGTAAPVDHTEPPFEEILAAVEKMSFRISERSLRRYHLGLMTRGFVILSGVSGTGKTWLTEVYAQAAGAKHLIVPVAPNWTTNEDLLGYFNPLDNRYHDTDFSRFLRDADREYNLAQDEGRIARPYHLVLDEMNLARVEYYFAKFLSAMEVRARYGIATIELGPKDQVLLPPNLRFAGTVNVDETTHGFADRVYDRAQLIELEASREAVLEHIGNAPYREVLIQMWDVVRPIAPFAFRTLDEIAAYVDGAEALSIPWQEALDEQLLQKVLPKLKGTDIRVNKALERLVELTDTTFPLSHTKVTKMLDEFRQHGFASYF